MTELEKENFEKIATWFYKNKKDIIKKASYPYYIPVSEQIKDFKRKNELNTFANSDTIARILCYNI